jgi:hypothetical protein
MTGDQTEMDYYTGPTKNREEIDFYTGLLPYNLIENEDLVRPLDSAEKEDLTLKETTRFEFSGGKLR